MPKRKCALVVGASRGIGKAIAIRLAKDGFDIAGSCRSGLESLSATAQEVRAHGVDFTPLVFDISNRKESEEKLLETFSDASPDVIVYNAGINADNLFVFMSGEEWDKVIHTNVDGFYNCVQPLLLGMMERKNGRIIVISSASGQIGQGGQVNYSAAKAALIGAAKALAREVGRKKILVNVVAPGFIDTDMTAKIPRERILPLIPLNRSGSPEEVANLVAFLAGEESSYIHGQVIGVNGGLVI